MTPPGNLILLLSIDIVGSSAYKSHLPAIWTFGMGSCLSIFTTQFLPWFAIRVFKRALTLERLVIQHNPSALKSIGDQLIFFSGPRNSASSNLIASVFSLRWRRRAFE